MHEQQLGNRTSFNTHSQPHEQLPIKKETPFASVCSTFAPPVYKEPSVMSEQQSQYTFKASDPNIMRNPIVAKAVFMKSYVERKLRNPPKPLQRLSSTTSRIHNWKVIPEETQINAAYMPVAVAPNNSIQINRIKPGYAKFLDNSATTTNSTYVEYPLNDLGIGSKDHITFYNWNKGKYNVSKTKETQCDKYKSAECPKRRGRIRYTVRAVPHGGQISEYKSSFGKVPNALAFDVSHIKTKLPNYELPTLRFESSNRMYGNGK